MNQSGDLIVPNRGGKAGSKQRRLILSEEEYTSTLTSIITRDYFPALPSLSRDAAILQKRSEGDIASAVAIRRAARQLEANEELCQQLEDTEEILASQNGGVRKRARPLERESIDGFHQRVTSEDNAEFEENMKREAIEKKQRMDLVYQTSGENFKKLGLLLANDDGACSSSTDDGTKNHPRLSLCNTPLMASDQFNPPVQKIQSAGTTVDGKNKTHRNSLFFTPEHIQNNALEDCGLEKGEVMQIESGSCVDMSASMPPPPPINNALVKPVSHSLSITAKNQKNVGQMNLVEYLAKPKNDPTSNEKVIVPSNTRFYYQSASRIEVPYSSNKIKEVGIKTSQLEYETDSSATTDLDATPLSLSMERTKRIKQIERDRETYVAMTPLIVPGRDDDSPIVTWGRVASTPLVIGPSHKPEAVPECTRIDENVSGFQLLAENEREIAARKAEQVLAKRADCFKEANKSKGRKMGSDFKMGKVMSDRTIASLDRTLSLTPAARSLLERATPHKSSHLTPKTSAMMTPSSCSSFGSVLRTSYTPSQKTMKLSSNRNQKLGDITKATPTVSTSATKAPISFVNRHADDIKVGTSTSGLLKK